MIAAHRVSHGGPFRSIDQLVVGDQVQFTLPQGTSTYEVTATDVVTPEAIDIITQSHEHTATLFACHPPGSTKFRYVVKSLRPAPRSGSRPPRLETARSRRSSDALDAGCGQRERGRRRAVPSRLRTRLRPRPRR